MKKIVELKNKISENQVLLSFLVFILCAVLLIILKVVFYESSNEFYRGILIEAFGMLFDIFVIGTFLFWLIKRSEKRLERKRNIKQYHDEIDDFRDWDSDEAMHRIVGNIKRLTRLKVDQIDLHYCYLKNAKLSYITIKNSNLKGVHLIGAICDNINFEHNDMVGVKLDGAIFINANLNNVDLRGASFELANFANTSLKNAKLQGAYLEKVALQRANLEYANLSNANLQDSKLNKANFKDTILTESNLMGADLREAKNLILEQLSDVQTLYKTKLDDHIREEIKESYPDLLKEPKYKLL